MNRTSQGLIMLASALLISSGLTALAWMMGPDPETSVTSALRWTGRLAFLLFLIPWLASPLKTLSPGNLSRSLLRWRRLAGIAFGGVQVVHLYLIVMLFRIFGDPGVDSATLIVGGMGIGLAMVMLATSFDGPLRLIGSRTWKALHRSGLYVFGLIYFFDFLVAPLAFSTGEILPYLPFMALTALALVLRISAIVVERRQSGVAAEQGG